MPSTGVRGESAGCGSVDVAGVVFVDLAGLVPGVVGVVVEVVVPEGADVPVTRLGVPEFCVVELDGLVVSGLVVAGLVVAGLVVSTLVVCGLVELVDFDRFLDHIHCLPSIVFSGFREGFGRAVDAGPPLVGLVLATELLERGRVSTVERRRPGVGGRGVELWNLQLAQRGCGIPEVQTCSGHRDREFHLHRSLECGAVDGPSELEGTFRAPEPALAVDHHGELVVAAGDPSVRAEFPERRGEVTETVGSDRGGLADHGDAAGSACSAQRVLVRFLRIGVDEERCGDEVSRHPVRVVLAEGLELSTSGGVEVAGIDLVGDLRVVVTRADRTGAVRVAVFPVVPSSLTEAGAGRAVTVTEPLPVGSTVAGGALVVAAERTVVAAERTITIATRTVVVAAERTVTAPPANGPVTITAGPVIVPTERTVTITAGPVVVPTERTVAAPPTHGPVTIATGAVIVPTERTVTIATGAVIVPTERTVTIATRTVVVAAERTVTIATGAVIVPTERTVTIATRTVIVPTERTVTIATRTVVVAAERTVTIATRTVVVAAERTVTAPPANGPVTVTAGPVIVPTERTVTIPARPVIVPTERTVTITTRPVIVPTERTVTITTRPVSCRTVRSPRRTVVPGSAFAEVATRGPTIRAVAARTIATRAPTAGTPTFTTLEVTRARRPTTAVAFAARSIRTVSVSTVSPLFVVVRHRSSSLRAETRAPAIVRCVVVSCWGGPSCPCRSSPS